MKTEATTTEETKKIVTYILDMMESDSKKTSYYDPKKKFEFDWGDYSPKN